MSQPYYIESEEGIPVACQDCDWMGTSDEVSPVKDLLDRICAGEIVPVGECPKCGALASYVDATAPPWSAQRQLHECQQNAAALTADEDRQSRTQGHD